MIFQTAAVASRKKTRRRAVQAPTKHQRRTEATRRALLKSARRIFARDGFEASRIEDVASSIGHTRGAFYAHFRTKDDLFFALLEQEAQRRVDRIHKIVAGECTPAARRAAVREFFVSRISDRGWAMLMMEFKLFAVRHPELRPRLAATHRRIRASLRVEGLGENLNDVRRAALEAVLAGFSLEHAYDPLRLSRRDAKTLLGDVFDALVPERDPWR